MTAVSPEMRNLALDAMATITASANMDVAAVYDMLCTFNSGREAIQFAGALAGFAGVILRQYSEESGLSPERIAELITSAAREHGNEG